MAEDLAGKKFWNESWSHLPPIGPYEGPVFEQHPVLKPFLEAAGGGDAIEIGCVPGNWLVYLAKEYGYRVHGIDYSEHLGYVRENLIRNGINPVSLVQGDFFSYAPHERFDLVFSSGFVEHFDDYNGVVARHVGLAKIGGLIVIMVPNLRWIHWVLSRTFAPDILRVHRLELMKRGPLRRALEFAGSTVLHCGFQKTFRPVYPLPVPVDLCVRAFRKGLRMLALDDIGNPLGSPYLIAVARRVR